MKFFIVCFCILLSTTPTFAAWNGFLGMSKALNDVQDENGDEDTNPISPNLGGGYNFHLFDGWGFSPQLGYIHNIINSDDSYGEYKMRTIYILYDALWVVPGFESFAIRGGLGTFMKTISGEGGKVTIPNGSGTAQATRPGGSQTSYSSTFNLGLDYNINFSTSLFTKMGVRFETFIFRPLSSENRNYAYNFGAIFYF